MHDRRSFLITTALASIGAAMPSWATDTNLAADTSQDDQPVRRRYLMEDTYGNIVKDEDLQGKFVLIYFGYMSCPDVCPTSLSTIANVMDKLSEEDNEGLAVLFVTVDPERDTAQALREYLGFFDERIIGLRGPKAYTDHMVKAFNARYEFYVPDPEHPEEYGVDHTASIAFVAPDGTLIKRFPHGMHEDKITAYIQAAMRSAREMQ
ncbi:SCO family protein [Aliiroseovarius crassostreae]|uniref:SCO family protein n=1 Tax=Aliiroseovarius crassostreae TaxID=154981 RepID=UPI003C7A3AD4